VVFRFDEMQYELNSVKIDRNRNVGITSIIKIYISLSSNTSLIMLNLFRLNIPRVDYCHLMDRVANMEYQFLN